MHRFGKGGKNEEVPSQWQKLLKHEDVKKFSYVVFEVTLK